MRILAIGLGGAGCRIVNSLYATDQRSSKVVCVQALAIDVNSDTLAQLGSLPENAKLFFPPFDPELHPGDEGNTQTATIDIGEIVSRIQNFESSETDAIFVCCGLGGSMVDVAPHIVASLRSSIAEPIFALVTLPCLAEGERHSAKAADDIEMLSPLLDGIILFDNETWYKKTKAQRSTLVKKERGLVEKLGFRKSEPDISPELATYLLLNEAIVRRISLILRAGEFKADGGLDLAEVVLDSGEVLNTMKGMGFITIGYAVERLPHHPLSFLTSWHPTGLFHDAHKIKASRIVDLAKQAIYHEISTPCDMTSAHKALILIAGPSHELSMKGYMTVRKWIDRSIAGLETRSGDYPVMNTKNVAIIIMLSGLENIPRITELKEIQNQYKSSHHDSHSLLNQSDFEIIPASASESEYAGISTGGMEAFPQTEKILKDEMLVLPLKSQKRQIIDREDSGRSSQVEEDYSEEYKDNHPQMATEDVLPRKISEPTDATKKTTNQFTPKLRSTKETSPPISADTAGKMDLAGSRQSRHQIVARDHEIHPTQHAPLHSSHVSSNHETPQNKKSTHGSDSRIPGEKQSLHSSDERLRMKETERQIIERELQRQRTIAISGHKSKTGQELQSHSDTSETVRLTREISKKRTLKDGHDQSDSAEVPPQPERRRIIIQRKRAPSEIPETQVPEQENIGFSGKDDDGSIIMRHQVHSRQADSERRKIDIKNSANKSKDHILEGKGIHRSEGPQIRDSALIHTHLKSKKKSMESKIKNEMEIVDQNTEAVNSPNNREKKTSKKDDISWI